MLVWESLQHEVTLNIHSSSASVFSTALPTHGSEKCITHHHSILPIIGLQPSTDPSHTTPKPHNLDHIPLACNLGILRCEIQIILGQFRGAQICRHIASKIGHSLRLVNRPNITFHIQAIRGHPPTPSPHSDVGNIVLRPPVLI